METPNPSYHFSINDPETVKEPALNSHEIMKEHDNYFSVAEFQESIKENK